MVSQWFRISIFINYEILINSNFILLFYSITAISMMVGVLLFPIGWDTPMVREVCGPESDMYALGQCGIRWAFILALIGVVDCIVLSILAFVLGTRYVKLLPDHYLPNGTKYKGISIIDLY